ncbi:MAG: pyridoxal-dependent decarboxylase, partial [Planctomycetota bacterium]|nr:pyridoxal-dependent decarboxylase [Planctomycetota bacterium]MDA1214765.1 pyridoxal-dependent decarboxylase [Planctomycetota bacterium]
DGTTTFCSKPSPAQEVSERWPCGDGPVLNWHPPEENCRFARKLLDSAPESYFVERGTVDSTETSHLADRFRELVKLMLSRGQNLLHPNYVGHQVPASVPWAGLFDAVGSVTNQVMAVYEMGPWATAIERTLVDKIGEQIGLAPETFSGLVTQGGSLANLTALLTARNVSLAKSWTEGISHGEVAPVMVVHGDAHYGVVRSAGILGIGTDHVVKAPLDDRRRMTPSQLDTLLESLKENGHTITSVTACACATPIGAFDPLEEIAAVCKTHGIWLHVDAAHGGASCFSPRYRHLVRGLELADSFILDAHKMMLLPALCAFVFYRNRDHRFDAFQQHAPYLFDPSNPGLAEYDTGLRTLECTKRAAAFGLWGVWSLVGSQFFIDAVDVTYDLTKRFHQMLTASNDFEPQHVPECNILAFRYLPDELQHSPLDRVNEIQFTMRQRIIQSGDFYLTQATLDGRTVLRTTIINPLTREEHIAQLIETLRKEGQKLLRT